MHPGGPRLAMTGLLTVSTLAFLLGMRHATDADHVIAVTTVVTRYRSVGTALAIGGAWGVGHSVTILVVGSGIILLGWVIPLRVELSLELAVGVMLVVLGAANMDGLFGGKTPEHPTEPHEHGVLPSHRLARPLLIGVVHGLAGSAAVALLVLATIPAPGWSLAYLAVFGVGTILGMMLITAAIALPLSNPRMESARLMGWLRLAAGIASLGFGLFLVYRVGLAEGLFGWARLD